VLFRSVIFESEYSTPALQIESLVQNGIGGVTIENIDLPIESQDYNEDIFRKYYKELLEQKNASGIYLLADNARLEVGIDYKTKLTEIQKERCKQIISFLCREDYADAVVQNSGCQYMILRIKWLLYNDEPMFNGRECQLTHMNSTQWKEITSICKHYAEYFLKTGKIQYNASTIYYITALASAHLGDFDGSYQAFNKISEENFYSQIRNKTWHMICDEKGIPINFTAEFDEQKYDASKRTGRAYVVGLSKSRKDLIYYHLSNMDWSSVRPGIQKNLEMGISYMGFSIYRAAGRLKKQ
jgi:hypothetical protein